MDHADRSDSAGRLTIAVVCCAGRGQVDACSLTLPAGATVSEAVDASGMRERHPALGLGDVGIWGCLVPPERALRDGDRVELYRPLRVAPMEARRNRHREQKRAGSKRPAPAS